MALSDPLFTPEALRNLAQDNGPEYAGRSRRALRWCADVIEAADAVVQESAEARNQDDALILQLVEALEASLPEIRGLGLLSPTAAEHADKHAAAIKAGRARLEGKP